MWITDACRSLTGSERDWLDWKFCVVKVASLLGREVKNDGDDDGDVGCVNGEKGWYLKIALAYTLG